MANSFIRDNIRSVCEVLEDVSAIVTLTEDKDLFINETKHVLSWEQLLKWPVYSGVYAGSFQ